MPTNDNSRTLTSMPDFVEESITPKTAQLYLSEGVGISFPTADGCQLRIKREGKTHGGYYAYKQHKSIDDALQQAVAQSIAIRKKYPITEKPTKFDGVRYFVRLDKRRDEYEYGYEARYVKDGKPASKIFSFGYKQPSPDKQLHGFRTAKLFRYYFKVYGTSFNMQQFSQWRYRRLYCNGYVPFQWSEQRSSTSITDIA